MWFQVDKLMMLFWLGSIFTWTHTSFNSIFDLMSRRHISSFREQKKENKQNDRIFFSISVRKAKLLRRRKVTWKCFSISWQECIHRGTIRRKKYCKRGYGLCICVLNFPYTQRKYVSFYFSPEGKSRKLYPW